MIHARPDYQRIQDPAGLIPPDEPVFMLRGQDRTAPEAVEYWAALQGEQNQGTVANDVLAAAARKHADRMRWWQREHGSKVADGPHPLATDGKGTNDPTEALARRLYALADRASTNVWGVLANRPGQLGWEETASDLHRFYRDLAGMLLRGES